MCPFSQPATAVTRAACVRQEAFLNSCAWEAATAADLRCIFCTCRVGNKEFVELFGWLAYGYNAIHKGQGPGGKLYVPVVSVHYKGEGAAQSKHIETA